jgi:hypothetical protein
MHSAEVDALFRIKMLAEAFVDYELVAEAEMTTNVNINSGETEGD